MIKKNDILFRKVIESDKENLFMLNNLEYVRLYSKNKNRIEWKKHEKWFYNMLNNKNIDCQVVTTVDKQFLGVVRFEVDNENEALIGISLGPKLSGRGFGTYILVNSINYHFMNYDTISIAAEIYTDNVASVKIFERTGFKLMDLRTEPVTYKIRKEEFYENWKF